MAVIERRPNDLFDGHRLLQDLCIPEPQNPEAFGFNDPVRCASCSACSACCPPSTSTQSRCSRQTKLTMYGPKGIIVYKLNRAHGLRFFVT